MGDMEIKHASDCAVHSAPAVAPGPCDCGATRNHLFNELVKALKFYASEGTWECDTAPDPGFSSIPGSALSDFDHGDKARAVLAKVDAKEKS